MCLSRLLIAGVRTVKYLAPDEWGDMGTHMHALPKTWAHLAERRTFVLADVSEVLRQLALDLFHLNLDTLRENLWDR